MRTVIRNGMVYENGRLSRRDVWLADGRICAEPEENLPFEEVDARGAYVLPALTDSHVHVNKEGNGFGTNADLLCIPSGIGFAIDAGSLGSAGIERFLTDEIPHYSTQVFALLHASREGQNLDRLESLQDEQIDRHEILRLFRKYPEKLCGIKIRCEEEMIRGLGLAPVKKCIAISEELQAEGISCPVTVHYGPLGKEVHFSELLEILRPGDVLAHIYQPCGEQLLDEKGVLRPCVREAEKRGVLFDLAHGRTNFTFRNIRLAGEQGFWADLLGTDIHAGNVWKLPAFSALNTMSMMKALGMPREAIFQAFSETAAAAWHLPGRRNHFCPGDPADLVILDEKPCETELTDRRGEKLMLHEGFQTRLVMQRGRICYCSQVSCVQ